MTVNVTASALGGRRGNPQRDCLWAIPLFYILTTLATGDMSAHFRTHAMGKSHRSPLLSKAPIYESRLIGDFPHNKRLEPVWKHHDFVRTR